MTRRLDGLAITPEAGVARDAVGPGVRVLILPPYLAYYRVDGLGVIVLRVLHGSLDQSMLMD